jgi:hypothetical protein
VIPRLPWRRAGGVSRSLRGGVLALLLGFDACARPPEQKQDALIAHSLPRTVREEPSAQTSSKALESGASGHDVPDAIRNSGGGSTSAPPTAGTGAVQATRVYYLVVIGAPEQFWKIATTPSDPEVVYVEEASELGRDGRRQKLVMAMSKAAVRRFTAAAKKLGMEVRVEGEH